MSEQPKIGDKIRISYEGVVGALDEYRIYLDEPAGFSCGIKCVGNVRVEVLERADDPAKEQIALGEQIRKQIKRHNGGRAALELLKQHGGPDFTIDGGPLPSRAGNIGGTVTDYEIGRCTSRALTEVRTVLSRAETALSTWSNFDALVVVEGEYFGHHSGREVDDSGYVGRVVVEPHPDIREMQAALEKVVELLSPWRRTGRPKRGRVAA